MVLECAYGVYKMQYTKKGETGPEAPESAKRKNGHYKTISEVLLVCRRLACVAGGCWLLQPRLRGTLGWPFPSRLWQGHTAVQVAVAVLTGSWTTTGWSRLVWNLAGEQTRP